MHGFVSLIFFYNKIDNKIKPTSSDLGLRHTLLVILIYTPINKHYSSS